MLFKEGVGGKQDLHRKDEPQKQSGRQRLHAARRTEGRGNVETYGRLKSDRTAEKAYGKERGVKERRKLAARKSFCKVLVLPEIQGKKYA